MISLLGYLTADMAVRLLPTRLADRLAVALARLVFCLRLPSRRWLERNLEEILPTVARAERRAMARAAFEHFALTLIDFLRLGRIGAGALERAIEVRGGEHLDRARASERGVIVVSAHTGNWEWGAAWLATRGARVHVIARPHPNRWVERLFARRRAARGVTRLAGRPLWPRAAHALRQREWVALMGDRRSADGSLGAWVSVLARRTGAVVLPAHMLRLAPGRYAACFEAPIPADAGPGSYRLALRSHVQRHAAQWAAFEPLAEGWV
jgi:Kdo2-lipid IVA lauroyltransferase/acyltransferase